MLMGRFEYSLDAKSRTNFPPKFRNEMGDTLYVTKWFDKCLVVYGQEQWDKLDSKFDDMPTVQSKELLRILYGNVAEVNPDKQGRILLPQYLKDHANITKDIVIIGAELMQKSGIKKPILKTKKQTTLLLLNRSL